MGSSAHPLDETLDEKAGARHWLYLMGAAETAKAENMPRLLRLAGDDMVAVKLLAQHWAELDAPHLFRHLLSTAKNDAPHFGLLQTSLFEEWPKQDLKAAIEALNDLRIMPGMVNLRMSLINTLLKTDPERGLQLLKQWEISHYQPDMTPLDAWATKDPRKAAEIIMSHGNNSDVFQGAMQRIGSIWAASDPAAALSFAIEMPAPLKRHLMTSVVSEWAKRDSAAATAWVSSQEDSIVRGILGIPLVVEWAKTDPEAALVWVDSYLKGTARVQAAGGAVNSMAHKDVTAAAAYVSALEPGGLKTQAVSGVVSAWIGDTWTSGATPEGQVKVSAALRWMTTVSETDARDQAFEEAGWRLFPNYGAETIAFLESESGAQAPQNLFNNAARHLAKNDPEAALKWTDNLSAERQPAARQGVLSEWMNSRPEAALEWVRGLPAGEERGAAIQTVSGALSGERARAWRESLPPQDRPAETGAGD